MESLKRIDIEIAKIESLPFTTLEGNETLANLKYIRETLLMIRGN